MDIQLLKGKWKSKTSKNLDSFMKYTKHNFFTCKLASYMPLNMEVKILNDKTFKRHITSTFIEKNQTFIMDGKQRVVDKKMCTATRKASSLQIRCMKKHEGGNMKWIENISVSRDMTQIKVQIVWYEDGHKKEARQVFIRET